MKKIFFALCTLSAFIFIMVSCDNVTSTSEGRIQGLYTISGNFLYPEMADTFYKVNNISDFELKDGDRAYLTLAYEIDNYYGASMAKYYIKSVENVLPVHGLTDEKNVDTSVYSSPIVGFETLPKYGAYWLWKKYHNFNVVYYGSGKQGDFKLSPVKLSGDTLCFALNAKIEDGDERMTQLLSFDVSSAVNMLPAEDVEKLVTLDSIYTKITTRWYDTNNDTVKIMYPWAGKYKNCF